MIYYIFIINGIILREILQTISRNLWKAFQDCSVYPDVWLAQICTLGLDENPLQWTLVWMNSSARFLCQMPGTHFPTNVPPNIYLFGTGSTLTHKFSDGWLMQPSSSDGFKGAQEGEPLRWPGIPMPSPIASPRTEAPETTTLTVGAGGRFRGRMWFGCPSCPTCDAFNQQLEIDEHPSEFTMNLTSGAWVLTLNCIKGNDEFSFGMSNRTNALFVLCILYSLSLHTPYEV